MNTERIYLVKEAIRMLAAGLSYTKVSEELKVPRATLYDWKKKCTDAGLDYEALREMLDEEVAERLFSDRRLSKEAFPPAWDEIIPEYQKPNRTLSELYQLYRASVPIGARALSSSSFYREYHKLKNTVSAETKAFCIANSYIPGEISMIDYSGDKLEISDGKGGKKKLDIFVAVLPYSHYIFAYATDRQTRDDWLEAIAAWFAFLDGVTKELWLDNSTSLVVQADKYSPKICSEFKNFCEQYSVVPYPTRPGKPQDKGSCERAVGLVQKHILSAMAPLHITSREQANRILLEKVKEFNLRPYSERPNLNRTARFESEEKHLLRPLPLIEYHPNCITFMRTVQKNNVVRYQDKRYPVRYGFVGRKVQVFLDYTKNLVTVHLPETGECIGKKCIDDICSSLTAPTMPEDLPEPLKRYVESKEELLERIEKRFGPELHKVGVHIAKLNNSFARRHLNGLLVLGAKFEPDILNKICQQVLKSRVVTFQRFKAIADGFRPTADLKKKIRHATTVTIQASDLRGADHYKELIERKRKDSNHSQENIDD